jgi:hypothetical protein
MNAAVPKLVDEAELARTTAVRQVVVLMRAAGIRVTEEDLRASMRYLPQERLLAMPIELADAIDWHRRYAPAELTPAFRATLEQLQREAAAGVAPAREDEIEAEIEQARAERRRPA